MKSKLAITSFILILSPLLWFGVMYLLALYNLPPYTLPLIPISIILSFVFSIISLFLIKKDKLEGKWYAIIALIISSIILIFYSYLLLFPPRIIY